MWYLSSVLACIGDSTPSVQAQGHKEIKTGGDTYQLKQKRSFEVLTSQKLLIFIYSQQNYSFWFYILKHFGVIS